MAPKLLYTEEQMKNALVAVKNGISINKASQIFDVPRTTLRYKHNGKSPEERHMGPDTVLTVEQEKDLVKWIFHVAKQGFPVSKDQLKDSVQLLVAELKIKTCFINGRPGDHWYRSFLKRNPEISIRTPQNLSKSRASLTEPNIRGWHGEVKSYMEKQGQLEIFEDDRRVLNCDETAFFLAPKGSSVLVRKGEKAVYNFVDCDEKECITTLITGNAAGQLAPPMVMFKYQRLPAKILKSIPDSWGVGKSENGWMTGESFFEYVVNILHPWLLREKITLPVVLFVDGHTSHLTMALSNFCSENKIILVALYPNATHILQPMDVSLFSPLKKEWKKSVQTFRMSNTGDKVSRITFSEILKEALDAVNAEKALKSGFKACGLCPFDVEAIDFSKLITSKPLQVCSPVTETVKKHLRFLETEISNDVLTCFEKSDFIWKGEVKYAGLFELWSSWKQKAGEIDTEQNPVVQHDDLNVPVLGAGPENFVERLTEDCFNLSIPMTDDDLRQAAQGETTANESSQSLNIMTIASELESSVMDNSSTTQVLIDSLINNIQPNELLQNCEITNENELEASTSMQGQKISIIEEDKENKKVPFNIPNAFKKALFWPGEKKKTFKRRPKEKVPAVASSAEWRLYHKEKEEKKQLVIQEKEEKKRIREQKAQEKKAVLEKKREERKRKLEEKQAAALLKKRVKKIKKEKSA